MIVVGLVMTETKVSEMTVSVIQTVELSKTFITSDGEAIEISDPSALDNGRGRSRT
jgi:hypothetical protein